jgi:hypothetical protein
MPSGSSGTRGWWWGWPAASIMLTISAMVVLLINSPFGLRLGEAQYARRAVWGVIEVANFDAVRSRVKDFAQDNDLNFRDLSGEIRHRDGLKVQKLKLSVEANGFAILMSSIVPVDDPVQESYQVGIEMYCSTPCTDWKSRGSHFLEVVAPVIRKNSIVERSVGPAL